jgi:hypothetical protein
MAGDGGSLMEQLVSDREREQAVARLRDGAADGRLTLDEFAARVGDAYLARTTAELDLVMAGLPALPEPQPRIDPTPRVVGVIGSGRLRGRWRPARPTRAVAVLGSAQLDLCDIVLDGAAEVNIRAIAVFGGIDIVVPEGVPVELTGLVVVGSKDYRVRDRYVRHELPLVRVRATAVFGGVTVRTRPFTAGRWGRMA